MDVLIRPGRLSGTVTPPPSKSMAHRLIIAAALAAGESGITNVAFSKDIEATLRCMETLGCRWQRTGEASIRIRGRRGEVSSPLPLMDCGESGSTLRFLIPVALAVAGGGSFTGHGRLMERPQKPYFDLFDEKGIFHECKDGVLTLRGRLAPGEYRLPGNVSSQFFTGLLYALSLLEEPSSIISTTALESADYVTMTIQALAAAGVEAAGAGVEAAGACSCLEPQPTRERAMVSARSVAKNFFIHRSPFCFFIKRSVCPALYSLSGGNHPLTPPEVMPLMM